MVAFHAKTKKEVEKIKTRIKYWAKVGDLINKETFNYFADNPLYYIECYALEQWHSLYEIKTLEYKGCVGERR